MMTLPDFEAWAIFAKVVDTGSFVGASQQLGLSQATVSKAIGRLERRLGTTLFHRTSRRVSLSESGAAALEQARALLAHAEDLEAQASAHAARPSGIVRMTAPMSFGIAHLGAILTEFMIAYPDVTVDLTLADHLIDIVQEGYDLALRISDLEDSSLMARRLASVRILLVGAPAYFARRGRPSHPQDLSDHTTLIYTNGRTKGIWRFHHARDGQYAVTVAGTLRVNNADIFRPALIAGAGLAMQPDFLVWEDVQSGTLEVPMPEWTASPLALYLVTPPSTLRPARVKVLMAFLAEKITNAAWAQGSARMPSSHV